MRNYTLICFFVIIWVFICGCSKEDTYDTISDSLINRSWNVEESYLRYEAGDTARYRLLNFDISVDENLMAYVHYRRDTVFIQPTADQQHVLWMFPFFPGTYDVHVCNVITESPNFHYWVRDDVEMRDNQPYSGIRSEFKLTAN